MSGAIDDTLLNEKVWWINKYLAFIDSPQFGARGETDGILALF